MYKITRKNRIKEQFQLCHANGDVALTVDVDLNVDEIAGRVNKAYETLAVAQNALKKDMNSRELTEAYGAAVIAVFEVIFGKENAGRIIDFYEGNHTEMLLDIFPFINNEIMPKIREASASRREQLIAAARMAEAGNRAARKAAKRR